MKDLVPCEILTSGLLDHPAVCAWNELQFSSAEPDEIQTLKKKNKSAIYRLRGVGPNGSNVIAKRCLAEPALIERVVYQQILPSLPMPALKCYGFCDDEDRRFSWLFLEDAGTEPYRASVPEHRALLSRWLALLHTAAGDIQAAKELPGRGPAHYLDHLRLGRAQIKRHADNPALTGDDSKLLSALVAQCDFLESNWRQIDKWCERMPRTFVHGDLKEKNLRVCHDAGHLTLLCFDWETAGWGMTGPDLVKCPDLDCYHSAASRVLPGLDRDALQHMFHMGVLFRTLAEINWEGVHLQFPWVERPRFTLRSCHERLQNTIQILGIK